MQDHHKISIIVGAGAVGLLIYLLLHKSTAVASPGSMVPDEAVSLPPVYPQNPLPPVTDGINIGGSPVNLTYNYANPLPTMAIGDNTGGECGCDAYCDTAGQKMTVQTVPQNVLDAAVANLNSYTSKIAKPRLVLQQSNPPGGAALVQPSSVGGQKVILG